jgi:hypothetical protein
VKAQQWAIVRSRLEQRLRMMTVADLLSPAGPAIRAAGEIVAGAGCLTVLAALFLPWYELAVALELPQPDGSLNAWEAFRLADIALLLLALFGLCMLAVSRAFGLPILLAPIALAAWGVLVVTIYSYFRPAALGVPGPYPGPPGLGFLIALCGSGGMLLGSQLAYVAAWAAGRART